MYENTMLDSDKQVDSFRFLDGASKRLVQSWIKMETPREIPWAPLSKPLKKSRVALISSAGLALKSDRPFDQEGERQNPWWGDPSFRILPRTVTAEDVNLYHMHIHPRVIAQDINTLFPVERLLQLEAWGEIGSSASHHYSYMGYILQPETLLEESVPAMIAQMQEEAVDIVLLVPG
jgi:D-proline reductase (dithiol) PrdB